MHQHCRLSGKNHSLFADEAQPYRPPARASQTLAAKDKN
jgi:hypothetical protein